MVDYVIPLGSSARKPTFRSMTLVKHPLQAFIRNYLKQQVFVKFTPALDKIIIKGYDGPIDRLQEALSRGRKKCHADQSVNLDLDKMKSEKEPLILPAETPEEVQIEIETLESLLTAQQLYVDTVEQEKSGLIKSYDEQKLVVDKEYQEQLNSIKASFIEEKANLDWVLAETQRQSRSLASDKANLEEKNNDLLNTLAGFSRTRSDPISALHSALNEQSIAVKRLDKLLSNCSVKTIAEILAIGTLGREEYVNKELGTNLTAETLESLTEKPTIFESTTDYAELRAKYDAAVGNKKLIDAFKTIDEAPPGIRDYISQINKEQVDKDISNYEIARSEHERNVDLFDKVRDRVTIWRTCNHAVEGIRTSKWSIPLAVTNYKSNGEYKLIFAAPSGEPGGIINNLLADLIKSTVKSLDVQIVDDKGLKQYTVNLPKEKDGIPISDIAVAQFGTVEELKNAYAKSDLAFIASLEVTELNRSHVKPKTASAPGAAQKV